MRSRRGVVATTDYDSAGSGYSKFEVTSDPAFPAGVTAPVAWFDASRQASKFRNGEATPYFYDLVSSFSNAQYIRAVAGGATPILVKDRPNANGKAVITFDHLQYYQVEFTGMVTSGNSFHYQQLLSEWTNLYTVQDGDQFCYDIYLPSGGGFNASQPFIGLDLPSGVGALRDSGAVDQNGLSAHPSTDITNYATDQWYERRIKFPVSWVGTTFGFDAVCEADTTGSYRARIRNIRVLRPDGTSRWFGLGAEFRQGGSQSASHGSTCTFLATTPDAQKGWFATSAFTTLAQPNTIIAVAYGWPDNTGNRNIVDGNSTSRNALYWDDSTSKLAFYANTARLGTTVESEPMAAPVIVAGYFSGSTSKLFRNGVTESTGVSPGSAGLDRIRIGTADEAGGSQWSDWIGELLVFDAGLTEVQIHQVGSYLGAKWGITPATPAPAYYDDDFKGSLTSVSMNLALTPGAADVAIFIAWTNDSNTFPTPTGWTAIAGGAQESNANMSYKSFWRRLDGGSDDDIASYTISGGTGLSGTNGLFGRMISFSNCALTGTPFEAVTATTPANSTTPTSTAISGLTGSNRLGVSIVIVDAAPTWASGMPPSTWANAGGRQSSTSGADGMTDAIVKTVNESGATDEASVTIGTMSATAYWASLTLALLPI